MSTTSSLGIDTGTGAENVSEAAAVATDLQELAAVAEQAVVQPAPGKIARPRPDRRLRLVVRYVRDGRFTDALNIYHSLLLRSPDDAHLLAAFTKLALAAKNTPAVKFALVNASKLEPDLVARCVNRLIAEREFEGLRDAFVTFPDAMAAHLPTVIARMRIAVRASDHTPTRITILRLLQELAPDDLYAKATLAREFKDELAACSALTGDALIEATSRILSIDRKQATAAVMKANACVLAGRQQEAAETLLALDDADLAKPRTLALFLSVSEHLDDLSLRVAALRRMSRQRGAHDVITQRATRQLLRAASAAKDPISILWIAKILLSYDAADEHGNIWLTRGTVALKRTLVDAIRSGDPVTVQAILDQHPDRLDERNHVSAARMLARQLRRAKMNVAPASGGGSVA